MTGMGSDGSAAIKLLKRQGAPVIAQDEASCAVYGMPREPIESGAADVIVPLGQIAAAICRLAKPWFVPCVTPWPGARPSRP
jgi:two-component system chemotaxis response regulator CheB